MIKIEITKADRQLQGRKLNLVQVEDMIYKCLDTNIRIIDTWDEIEAIKRSNSMNNTFYDLHLFSDSFSELEFIYEIKIINNKNLQKNGKSK